MESLLNSVGLFVNQALAWVGQFLTESASSFQSDEVYRSGFLAAWGWLALIAVLGFGFNRLMWVWDRILQFFRPTETPGDLPTNAGPSPFESFMNMMAAFVILGLIILVVMSM